MKRLNRDTINGLARAVEMTQPIELACGDCWDLLDRFAEVMLAGERPGETLKLVEDHLHLCGPCSEEFEALLRALRGAGATG